MQFHNYEYERQICRTTLFEFFLTYYRNCVPSRRTFEEANRRTDNLTRNVRLQITTDNERRNHSCYDNNIVMNSRD